VVLAAIAVILGLLVLLVIVVNQVIVGYLESLELQLLATAAIVATVAN
jgi:hypothetical protein